MYPDANIWVTGHSLGGSLSGLLGVTFGAPVVTFEAPADKMAARRLHLPKPVCPFPVSTGDNTVIYCTLLMFLSHSPMFNMSLTYSIRRTRFLWEHVLVYYLLALSLVTLWKVNVTLGRSAFTTQ